MARVLVIGDIHEPVSHPGYLPFCRDLRDTYKCDHVVFIGDVVDWHAVSFHTKHPDAPGPKDEYELAKVGVAKWNRAFAKASVCVGNHDERIIRVAEEAGIPDCFLRNYADIWQTPRWTWGDEFIIDDVYYFHGTGTGGMHPAFNSMKKMLMSVVQGHIHSAAGIKWCANPTRRIFGMDTGCGIDDKAYAFAYGKHQKVRSMISAGVVLDGIPYHHICPIGPGEKYHRSRFTGGLNEAGSGQVRDGGDDRRLHAAVCAAGGVRAAEPERGSQHDPRRGEQRQSGREPREVGGRARGSGTAGEQQNRPISARRDAGGTRRGR